jgi:hypothetical protein
MLVRTLIAVTDPKYLESCTYFLNTVRVGFPKADIIAEVNLGETIPSYFSKLAKRGSDVGVKVCPTPKLLHHADWIRRVIEDTEGGPLVIIDPDTHFWKSCEDWEFPGYLMAGYYVPEMWNDFSKCKSYARLHSSFLFFPDVTALKERIQKLYPYSFGKLGNYHPCDPFMPSVKFVDQKPVFWDTCSVLYHMVGGYRFTEKELDCYEHLNSASAVEIMCERMENPQLFRWLHTEGIKHPELIKQHNWKMVTAYYMRKAMELKVCKP